MPVTLQIVIGLLLAHIAWFYCYVVGTILDTRIFRGRHGESTPVSESEHLLHIVVATASGLAITGFATFVLGIARLLFPEALAAWSALLIVAFIALGDSPFRIAFWRSRLMRIRSACEPAMLAVYALALVLSIPAILPETQFDALWTHFVVAIEYAHSHRIFVDPWRRFPYYTYNYELLDMWAFAFGLGRFVNFLSWLTATLTLLGVYSSIVMLCIRSGLPRYRWAATAGFAGSLAVALSPIFLRYVDTGMVDIADGLFFLICVMCIAATFATNGRSFLAHYVVAAGFLVGMKTSFIILLPVLIVTYAIIAFRFGNARRSVAIGAALIIVLSSPWYFKAFVQSGDPIEPALNLAIRGKDIKWDKDDMTNVMTDLHQPETELAKLFLPVLILEDTSNRIFREFGTTLMLGLVGFPMLVAVYIVVRGRRPAPAATITVAAFLAYAVAYWLGTAPIARYTLLFFPALCVFVLPLIMNEVRVRRLPMSAGLAGAMILAVPASPAAWSYVQGYWQTNIAGIVSGPFDREAYLSTHVQGYSEALALIDVLARSPIEARKVYMIESLQLDFFFQQHDITAMGDWFGPERWGDMTQAIDHGRGLEQVRKLGAHAVMIEPNSIAVPADEQRMLTAQLEAGGFRKLSLPNSGYVILVGPDVTS